MAKEKAMTLDEDRESSLAVQRSVVVNVRREHCDVYVGRKHPRAPKVEGRDGRYGNPYSNRIDWAERYAEDMLRRLLTDKEYRKELEAMDGKKLGCWCYPNACHGMILSVWCNATTVGQNRMLKLAAKDMESAVKTLLAAATEHWGA